jgi:putative multiple sugar transport system permease protein
MGVGSDSTQMIKGLVLLAAVAFDVYNKIQGRPSIIGLLTRSRRRTEIPGGPEGPGGGPVTASKADSLAQS